MVKIRSSLILLLGLFVAAAGAAERTRSDWPVYGGDFAGTKFSPLKQINRSNVRQLQPAWVYRCDDMRASPPSTIECNPLIVDGVMFITTPGLKVVALRVDTGTALWVFDPWQAAGEAA